jgi:ABC-2 type transport system ATP-binding protein
MRQRLGIARCLLADPQLLILDEPMNGLDPAGIQELRVLIKAFVDEGRTVFLSSHLLDEVEKTCDHVAIIDRGRILTQGPIADVAQSRRPTVLLRVDDPERAAEIVATHRAIETAAGAEGALRLSMAVDGAGLDQALADINERLVRAGVRVSRIEPARVSLEERFLNVTSRLGDDAPPRPDAGPEDARG